MTINIHVSVTSTLRRISLEDEELKASLGYRASS
jgi:hypothetical protein